MKYKNIELIAGEDREDELLCNVEFENKNDDEKIQLKMEDKLLSLFKGFTPMIYMETVMSDLIQVRCWDITFDKDGISLLKKMYTKLIDSGINANFSIGVHVQDEWFRNEEGKEYNEDDVTWEEFVANLEY